ncbi:MAG TPA: VOC family protein [Vicinamibacterales bacterium]|nr:VOC family protein [Vicinamibacterales bacterium]
MIKRLVHVGLTVADLETMLHFYTSVLGLAVTFETPHPQGGSVFYLNGTGGESIELIHFTTPKPHDGRDMHRTGLHHFGLLVEDVRKETERLKSLGVEFDGSAFWDPEGNRIHLIQLR